MDAKEFNNLINLRSSDKQAADDLQIYCLKIIKRRLLFRNGLRDLESLSHSILLNFVSNLPEYYIFAPTAYLNKCTDNYLSTLKSKNDRETALTSDISYEQNFDSLDSVDTFQDLVNLLGMLDAKLIYGHCVEGVPEKQLAKDFDMTYTAVRQRISRSKKKLKILLKKHVT